MNHTFSFTITERVPRLVRRPWWDLFGRDRIEMVDSLRTVAYQVTPEEAALIEMSSRSG